MNGYNPAGMNEQGITFNVGDRALLDGYKEVKVLMFAFATTMSAFDYAKVKYEGLFGGEVEKWVSCFRISKIDDGIEK